MLGDVEDEIELLEKLAADDAHILPANVVGKDTSLNIGEWLCQGRGVLGVARKTTHHITFSR